ncbi:MAG: DsbA family protein [Notoacmeibacter sp.]|nr:DsbA family protein [Notoacmeibacter sp.]MCC0033048.1 DsbA family protein [Brucellaceae bacterium]
MKMTLSKPVTAIFAAPFLALALTACSDNSGSEKKAAEAPAKPAAEAPAKTEAPAAKPAEAPAATPAKAEVKVPEAQGEADVAKLMEAGALPDQWLGDEKAPVTIIEYASTTCGHCAHFHETTWPELKKAYIDTGKVHFVLREFPFDPRATAAFMLARCSGSNYYPMIDVLFSQQNVWARAPQETAAQVMFQTVKIAGFSQESFDACLKDQQLLDNVNAVRNKAADEFKVDATPTFFINGKKYSGAMPFAEMAAIIDSME